jgi:hypothetical protein
MPKHLADDWRRAYPETQVHFWRSEPGKAATQQDSDAQPVCYSALTRRTTESVIAQDISANICPFCPEWYNARSFDRANLEARS